MNVRPHSWHLCRSSYLRVWTLTMWHFNALRLCFTFGHCGHWKLAGSPVFFSWNFIIWARKLRANWNLLGQNSHLKFRCLAALCCLSKCSCSPCHVRYFFPHSWHTCRTFWCSFRTCWFKVSFELNLIICNWNGKKLVSRYILNRMKLRELPSFASITFESSLVASVRIHNMLSDIFLGCKCLLTYVTFKRFRLMCLLMQLGQASHCEIFSALVASKPNL